MGECGQSIVHLKRLTGCRGVFSEFCFTVEKWKKGAIFFLVKLYSQVTENIVV